MNRRQQAAHNEMRYLWSAWEAAYEGPPRHPVSSIIFRLQQKMARLRREFDEARVKELHQRWLRLADQDRYLAAILKLHYRDGYAAGPATFSEKDVLRGLDAFSQQ